MKHFEQQWAKENTEWNKKWRFGVQFERKNKKTHIYFLWNVKNLNQIAHNWKKRREKSKKLWKHLAVFSWIVAFDCCRRRRRHLQFFIVVAVVTLKRNAKMCKSFEVVTWIKAVAASTTICIGNLFVRINATIVPVFFLSCSLSYFSTLRVYVWRFCRKNYR